jgi:phosphatidylserine decarboxylase
MPRKMKIHKEGYRLLSVWGSIILTAVLLVVYGFPGNTLMHVAVGMVGTCLFLLILQFFRSPVRQMAVGERKVVCPADGKVVAIEEVEDQEYFHGEKRIQVSIFMSPLNVHLNRYPIAGRISYAKYHPGKFLVAWHPKSSTENERNTVVIETRFGVEVLVRQIAGFVARRIVWYCEEDEHVDQCAELGFIKFGSRVDLLLPLNADIQVELEQKVRGGVTVIAEL